MRFVPETNWSWEFTRLKNTLYHKKDDEYTAKKRRYVEANI